MRCRRAKKDFAVTEEDHRKLLALGNRSGFTDGYYFRRNGREMITFDSHRDMRKTEGTAEDGAGTLYQSAAGRKSKKKSMDS